MNESRPCDTEPTTTTCYFELDYCMIQATCTKQVKV